MPRRLHVRPFTFMTPFFLSGLWSFLLCLFGSCHSRGIRSLRSCLIASRQCLTVLCSEANVCSTSSTDRSTLALSWASLVKPSLRFRYSVNHFYGMFFFILSFSPFHSFLGKGFASLTVRMFSSSSFNRGRWCLLLGDYQIVRLTLQGRLAS